MEELKRCGVRFPLLGRRRRVSAQELMDAARLKSTLRTAAQINEHAKAMEQARRAVQSDRDCIAALSFWKACPIPLDTTGTEQTHLVFGTVNIRIGVEELEQSLPEESAVFEIDRTKERRYLAVLCHRDCDEQVRTVLARMGFSAASLEQFSGSAAAQTAKYERAASLHEREWRHHRDAIAAQGAGRSELQFAYDQAQQYLALEQAKEHVCGDGAVVALDGWIPAECEAALERLLEHKPCAWQTVEPSEEDTPPTALKNPRWMRPINVVTEMYSLPDYHGIDPNPLIFLFYIFFFGFMFADVAYGLVLLAVSLFVTRRWAPKGAVGQLMHLGVYLGISTFLCGLLTGGFFGNSIEIVATQFMGLTMEELPLWLRRFAEGFVFSPLTSPMAVLLTTLVIGAVQLVFGQCVHIYMQARRGDLWGGILDTVPWWVFFAGAALWALGKTGTVCVIGILLLVLTQGHRKKGIFGKLLGGVAGLYNITNWLSDVLSYSRLMALMLATSVIASVINTIGALPGSIAAFVPVFIIGHLFNIAVNLIGTYVHAARLQYLEFYGKFYKEGGVPFRPLCYNTKYTDVIEEE